MKIALIMTIVAAVLGSALATSFVRSLPTWCADPSGKGNWVVVSLGWCRGDLKWL